MSLSMTLEEKFEVLVKIFEAINNNNEEHKN